MKMKILSLIIFIISFSPAAFSQSPYYSMKVSIKQEPGDNYTYRYFHTICQPKEWSTRGDTFDHDTSRLSWDNLSIEYLSGLECKDLESESDSIYFYGNQMMVYENIMKVTVVRSGAGAADTMRMIFPVKIKSFVTYINITNIPFYNKTYDLTNDMEYSIKGMYLSIKPAADYEWIPGGK
jgi:hypothetical protein